MQLLSLMKEDFQLSKLSAEDRRDDSGLLRDFCSVVVDSENSYPDISKWLKNQVIPELGSPKRTVVVAHSGNRPVAAAVFKFSNRSKLCHLSVVDHARRHKLGDALLGILALQMDSKAEKLHFTIPESVWEEQKGFFMRFGFSNHGEATRQYRLFDRELYCSVDVAEYSRRALGALGVLSTDFHFGPLGETASLLLSVKPKFANRILSGGKTVEVRRRFSRRWIGHKVAIYASGPQQAVVGEAKIGIVDCSSPEIIWSRYGRELGCELGEFLSYCGDRDAVTAVGLCSVVKFDPPLKRSSLKSIYGSDMRPPQSYFLLNERNAWSSAVSLASTVDNSALDR